MPKILLTVWGYECGRCGWQWLPREWKVKPLVCPKCKNPYWDEPRTVSVDKVYRVARKHHRVLAERVLP